MKISARVGLGGVLFGDYKFIIICLKFYNQ